MDNKYLSDNLTAILTVYLNCCSLMVTHIMNGVITDQLTNIGDIEVNGLADIDKKYSLFQLFKRTNGMTFVAKQPYEPYKIFRLTLDKKSTCLNFFTFVWCCKAHHLASFAYFLTLT